MTVLDAVVTAPILDGPAAMYLTIGNSGEIPDTLVAVSAPDVGRADIHRQSPSGGALAQMEPVAFLEIPVDSIVSMRPGGTHVMLEGGAGGLAAGDTIDVELTFQRAGAVRVPAVVVKYEELQTRLGAGGGGAVHH